MSKKLFPKILAVLLSVCMVLSFAGCGGNAIEQGQAAQMSFPQLNPENLNVENLVKLCKVWGYTKYHHPVFLQGEKDWDVELLNMMTPVNDASPEQANKLLNDWFVSLGKASFRKKAPVPEWVEAKEKDKKIMADTAWVSDAGYLGEDLSASLQQMGEIPNINLNHGPASFLKMKMSPDFQNEPLYANMNYGDLNFRLLGLFRLWNAVEYYYPYRDILDENWSDMIAQFIPKMAEGKDQHSYEIVISELSTKLQDRATFYQTDCLAEELGKYAVPVKLCRVDDNIVVDRVLSACVLKEGDIILKLNGEEISKVLADRQRLIPVSNEEKALNVISPYLLRSKEAEMEVSVLRDSTEQNLQVVGIEEVEKAYSVADKSYEILDNNIGLINPSAVVDDEVNSVSAIMKNMENTDGLIVDLRQMPRSSLYFLSAYVNDSIIPSATEIYSCQAVPGTFLTDKQYAGYHPSYAGTMGVYHYEKPVVFLINEDTYGMAEYDLMGVDDGKNVTLMGSNTAGANGSYATLPMPGGKSIYIIMAGFADENGEQIQRVGFAPDIEVKPTIEGIKEGRDELMEAAIKYLTKQK